MCIAHIFTVGSLDWPFGMEAPCGKMSLVQGRWSMFFLKAMIVEACLIRSGKLDSSLLMGTFRVQISLWMLWLVLLPNYDLSFVWAINLLFPLNLVLLYLSFWAAPATTNTTGIPLPLLRCHALRMHFFLPLATISQPPSTLAILVKVYLCSTRRVWRYTYQNEWERKRAWSDLGTLNCILEVPMYITVLVA